MRLEDSIVWNVRCGTRVVGRGAAIVAAIDALTDEQIATGWSDGAIVARVRSVPELVAEENWKAVVEIVGKRYPKACREGNIPWSDEAKREWSDMWDGLPEGDTPL